MTSGEVWLDGLQCTGEELDIYDCVSNDWGVLSSACTGHTSDAGVNCLCMYRELVQKRGLKRKILYLTNYLMNVVLRILASRIYPYTLPSVYRHCYIISS